MRSHYFWSNEFLTLNENNKMKNRRLLFTIIQSMFWVMSFMLFIRLKIEHIAYSKFALNDDTPIYIGYTYRTVFYIAFVCGYFIGNSYESYYIYIILHNYFQLKMLSAYICYKMKRYVKLPFKRKWNSNFHQNEVCSMFIVSIKQFQKIKS